MQFKTMAITNSENMIAFCYNKKNLNELLAVCNPLFKLSENAIKTFSYHCYFPDQTHFSIGTDLDWMEYFLTSASDSGEVFLQAIRQTPLNTYKYFLWPSHHQDDHILLSLHAHNIWNGMSIIQRHKDYIEMWSFSSTRENDYIKNFYLNNLENIKLFIKSFRYKTSKFIDSSKCRPLAIFKNKLDISYLEEHGAIEQMTKRLFEENLCSKKIIITTIKEKIVLTKREYECLSEISKGKTYKDVARTLSSNSKPINARTVESYIVNIKNKFNVSNKSSLITNYHTSLI